MLTGSLAGSQPGAAIETFTILTMAANETVVSVHGCMPFILPLEAYGPWLAGEEVTRYSWHEGGWWCMLGTSPGLLLLSCNVWP